jgi:hypothetical protein
MRFAWSRVISATALEDEIKLLKQQVDGSVKTPADFAGRGRRLASRDFGLLAMLFAIISEYDAEVRFQQSAAGAQQAFSRSAALAAEGDPGSAYREAELRKQELDELLRGSRPDFEMSSPRKDWSAVVGRPPLMQRLEIALQERLLPLTADAARFKDQGPTLLHEAEIAAAIAEVLTRQGMADAEDEAYALLARRMQETVFQVRAAVGENRVEEAARAAGAVSQICSECHETYR